MRTVDRMALDETWSTGRLPLADVGQYPVGVTENTWFTAGYSHRIAQTATPGVYVGVWVEGPEGAQDIYYRFFEK